MRREGSAAASARSGAPVGARLGLRLAYVQAEAVEVDVGLLEAVDLGAPQAGVERERVWDLVVGVQYGEQLRGLFCGAHAHAGPLIVGRELDAEGGVAV